MTLNLGYLGVVHLLQTKLERVVSPLNLKGGLEKHPNYFLGSYYVHHLSQLMVCMQMPLYFYSSSIFPY